MSRPGPKRILQITSYPPPRTGWGVRVQFLKRYLEGQGHRCVVLNVGPSRTIPSDEYETVLSPWDYVKKVWRFSRQGFVAHVHVNGASKKGLGLALTAELINLAWRRRCFLTFHAGVEQLYFPRRKSGRLLPAFLLLFRIPQAIICNSEDVKARILEYGVDAAKVFPIPAFSTQYLEAGDGPLPAGVEDFYSRFGHVVFSYTKFRRLFFTEVLVEGFARLAHERSDVGLVLAGTAGHSDPGVLPAVEASIARHDLKDRVLIVEDLPHEVFLTALGRSSLYLRTHLSDGVCSSVLEALALGVPVVATENGTRPAAVITYPAEDVEALASRLRDVLSRREDIVATLERPRTQDTLDVEARLLTA